ncbi:MAG: hypothetical protein PF484_09290 [Bacteroidales bacterium]|jgi:hypothetical protein|nr:hypothetical protein [Bacteroidales bacterium]
MKNKNNTPKRKRLNRNQRIPLANDWLKTYKGKNVVKGYRKWFGVDLLCAITELRLIGVEISIEYESKIRQSIENYQKRKKEKAESDNEPIDSFDNEFEFIAGYTSNGIPFGITKEEFLGMKYIIDQDRNQRRKERQVQNKYCYG